MGAPRDGSLVGTTAGTPRLYGIPAFNDNSSAVAS